jgi:hypothetical protein
MMKASALQTLHKHSATSAAQAAVLQVWFGRASFSRVCSALISSYLSFHKIIKRKNGKYK